MTAPLSAMPVPGKPRSYHFPRTERHQLSSGSRVVVAPLAKLPLITVAAVFHHAGAGCDPHGREGLAQLTASMLLEGTESRDGAALAEQFESLGTSLSASADWDATTMAFTVQPSRLAPALDALRDVLRAPAFPARHLARLQAEHRAGRLQLTADPRGLADAAFAWSCYGDSSRYRRPVDGTIASIDAISRDDVVAFWRTQYVPHALTVVLAGDVLGVRGVAAAEALVDGWNSEPSHSSTVTVARRYSETGVTLVEKAGAAQAELRIGHIGVPRSHESYFPLTVMNAVLGGLFSSRINLNLREQHGYTYGAFSGFDWRKSPGPWAVSTAVKTEVCGAATREVLAEIDRMRSSEIARDELELAANYLVGVFPLRFETTAAVASALASQATFGLPDDYFDRYRDHIAAVSPADVLDAARTHLHPAQLQIVAVGDPEMLRADLAQIGGGRVRGRTPEEVEAAP